MYNFEFHLDFYIGVLRQGFWRFLKIYFAQYLYLLYWRSVNPRNLMQFLQSLMVCHLTQLLFSDLRLTGALSGLKLFLDTQEKSGSWDIGQNAVSQSDCRIFKLTISLEQNDKKYCFFALWYRSMEIKSESINIVGGMVKNGCSHSGVTTLKLAVSQEGINWINWFLMFW